MAYFYFDESIREKGRFIIGALVIFDDDISYTIHQKWISMGLNPELDEYKSSALKQTDKCSDLQRDYIKSIVRKSKVAFVVLPIEDRKNLGNYCAQLIGQLFESQLIGGDEHHLYIDDNIKVNEHYQLLLREYGFNLYLKSDSSKVSGIQVADHASHALGGMLLEKMNILKKRVSPGSNLGYHPDELVTLGFELWASLRHVLMGKNLYIEGYSPVLDDPVNPYFSLNGYGMLIAPTASKYLTETAINCFDINYLGCIH